LEEHVAVHVDPSDEPYTHLAPDENMYDSVVTEATFQLAMFSLKVGLFEKREAIFVTAAVFQPLMGP
jgi:hypothetical protein